MSGKSIFGIDREIIWRNKREAKAYYHALRYGPPNSVRLLIFAQGRTGSTVLENLLASTGHFKERGELLGANNERVRFPASYLKGMARINRGENFQCHVKIYHLDRDRKNLGVNPVDPARFLKSLHEVDWKIVYLRRRNKFQHYISGQIAKARGGYHKYNDTQERLQITIDREKLRRGITTRRKLDRQEADVLRDIPHMSLVYEDHLQDTKVQAATVAKVLEYIDLESRPAKTRMKKIVSMPQNQIITNYADALRWAEEMGEDA